MRRIPDGLLAKLVFASGLVWMLFGVVIFIALLAGSFGGRTADFPGLIPFFGFINFQVSFAVNWLHMIGLFLAPIFCVVVGLAICTYSVGASQAERA
jgi:hypothetical protein